MLVLMDRLVWLCLGYTRYLLAILDMDLGDRRNVIRYSILRLLHKTEADHKNLVSNLSDVYLLCLNHHETDSAFMIDNQERNCMRRIHCFVREAGINPQLLRHGFKRGLSYL